MMSFASPLRQLAVSLIGLLLGCFIAPSALAVIDIQLLELPAALSHPNLINVSSISCGAGICLVPRWRFSATAIFISKRLWLG
ncbi:MAG: hypothetical protein HWD59_00280 [Coxiellaceae bacterium]|nr:MAG: hypothetical protein HWD59_00280 [Coxiellaceae bacterium]